MMGVDTRGRWGERESITEIVEGPSAHGSCKKDVPQVFDPKRM